MSGLMESFCAQFLVVLVHFLWQGALIAVALGIVLALLNRSAARVRYAASVVALLLMAACPAATFVWGGGSWERDQRDVRDQKDIKNYVATGLAESEQAGVMESEADGRSSGSSTPLQPMPPQANPRQSMAVAATLERAVVELQGYARQVFVVYLAGVALMLLRLAAGLGGGKRLRRTSQLVQEEFVLEAVARQARELGLRAAPAVAWCGKVLTPTVVGVVRPMVLLPMSVLTGLAPGQLELLLLHELAHVRRLDPLVNVLQRVIEALLFFHPAVWYVSRRVRLEREHCCDEIVLAHGGERRAYAESLLQAATLAHLGRAGAAAGGMGALGGGSDLRRRMRRVLGVDTRPVRIVHGGLLLAAIACGIAIVAFAGTADLSPTQNAEPAPASTAAEAPAETTAPSSQLAAPAAAADAAEPKLRTAPTEELLAQLKDQDWWLRKVAAQQLGSVRVGGDVTILVEALIPALKDEDDRVKVAAAESLGQLGDPRAIKHLVAALKEERQVQQAAVEALKKFPEELVLPILSYAAVENMLRDGALQVLKNMHSPESIDVLLAAAANAPEGNSHYEFLGSVAEGLQQHPWDQVEPRLRTQLESNDKEVVSDYLTLIGKLDKPQVDDVLIKFSKDPDVRIRNSAVSAAGSQVARRKGENSAELLEVLRLALRDEEAYVRRTAGYRLQETSWEPPSEEDRAWYLAAVGEWDSLAKLGAPALEPLLLTVSTDATKEAVETLAKYDDPRVLPALTNALLKKESDLQASDTAVAALERMGSDQAVDALIEGTRAEKAEVRWAAANALGRLKAAKAVAAMRELMRSSSVPQGTPTADAVMAVFELGGEGAVQEVADFLAKLPADWVDIARGLVQIGTAEAAESLRLAYEKIANTSIRGSMTQMARYSESPDIKNLLANWEAAQAAAKDQPKRRGLSGLRQRPEAAQ